MKTSRGPLILLMLLYLAFLGYLLLTSGQVPARVATHFNIHGQPNGWMSRSSLLRFMSLVGSLLPLVIIGAVNLGRLFPSALNMPRKKFWLAPERRHETFRYLSRQGLWFACIIVLFMIGLQFTLVQANAQSPVQLSMPLHFVFAGTFLAAIALWIMVIIRHFLRVPADGSLM